eukprot:9485930-Pyramimonas_sp.AAC.1
MAAKSLPAARLCDGAWPGSAARSEAAEAGGPSGAPPTRPGRDGLVPPCSTSLRAAAAAGDAAAVPGSGPVGIAGATLSVAVMPSPPRSATSAGSDAGPLDPWAVGCAPGRRSSMESPDDLPAATGEVSRPLVAAWSWSLLDSAAAARWATPP